LIVPEEVKATLLGTENRYRKMVFALRSLQFKQTRQRQSGRGARALRGKAGGNG